MKHVHLIGVAGSAIAPIAILMKQKGWKVTGSDEGVYDPALTLLNNNEIKWFEGYDPIRIENADLVVIGGAPLMKNPNNPEFIKAKELNKPLKGYDYVLQEYIVKPESIVIAGSYGKTTTSALITWILETAGLEPSFMIGGKPVSFDTGVRSTASRYSVMEGDEFLSVFNFDTEPRFTHYSPKYAILSATKWDHINVYPTEQSYIEAYYKLVRLLEKNNGVLFLCASGENNEKIMKSYDGKFITYMIEGKENKLNIQPDYTAVDIKCKNLLTSFEVKHRDKSLGRFESTMIGVHNVENCLAAISLVLELGIDTEIIKNSLKTFKGITRRQEIKGKTKRGATVIDDFAHSPIKAQATIEAIRSTFPNHKIIAIYSPRMSEREDRTVLDWYPGIFDKADEVILPRITVKASTPKEKRIYGKDLAATIAKTQPNTRYIARDEDIIKRLNDLDGRDSIFLFMSAGGWRDLMKSIISKD